MRAVVAVLFAGCGFAPTLTTSDGSVVDTVDALDGSPNADTDHDGINDAVDNCISVPNHDQHDEDGDNVGDVCDPCPQIAHESPVDTDSDGIPDACDPHPNNGGDKLFAFYPLTGSTIPQGWITIGGDISHISVANDAMTIDGTSSTQLMYLDTGKQKQVIEVEVDLSGTGSGTRFFTVLTDMMSDATAYFGCGLRIDLNQREFITYDNVLGFNDVATDPAPTLDVPAFPGNYRIYSELANNQACEIPGVMNRHKMTGMDLTNGNKLVGLRVGVTVAVVRWIAVYTF